MKERKTYSRPQLVEYGPLTDVTQGSKGGSLDFSFSGGQLTIDDNSPSCSNNVLSGACVTVR